VSELDEALELTDTEALLEGLELMALDGGTTLDGASPLLVPLWLVAWDDPPLAAPWEEPATDVPLEDDT